ncbi:MAG: gliding motility protein GldL [Bacteroidota bacterium]
MSFLKSKSFKYVKNLIIGVGAAFVLAGALFKIESWPFASEMLILGMGIEAFIFAFLGIIGPEPDYYWDKLYPGLADYDSNIQPLTAGPAAAQTPGLNGEVVEKQLGGMLTELQGMSNSLGSLKALQEADFSGVSDQVKSMTSFYGKLNEAMADLSDSVEDTKQYKAQLTELNKNIASLNNSYSALSNVYGNVIGAMSNAGK